MIQGVSRVGRIGYLSLGNRPNRVPRLQSCGEGNGGGLYESLDSALGSGDLREIYSALHSIVKNDSAQNMYSVGQDLLYAYARRSFEGIADENKGPLTENDAMVYGLVGSLLLLYSKTLNPPSLDLINSLGEQVVQSPLMDKDSKYVATLVQDSLHKKYGLRLPQAHGLSKRFFRNPTIDDFVQLYHP